LQYYSSQCHGGLLYNHTNYFLIRPTLIKMVFTGVDSFSRNHVVRQTVPYGNYSVGKIKFPYVVVTMMLNRFVFVACSPN